MLLLLLTIFLPPVFAGEAGGFGPHDPIIITGDSGFTSENGVTRGSGLAEDPYVIENWSIDASEGPEVSTAFGITPGQGVLIVNTTAHVLIRNVFVHSGIILIDGYGVLLKHGISLINAVNVRIEASLIIRNGRGIEADRVSHIVVENSHLIGNFASIVLTEFSDHNRVASNTILDGHFGVEVIRSSDNIVSGNRVIRHLESGIFLVGPPASRNLVVDNVVMNSGKYGIEVRGASSNIYRDNLVMNNEVGFWMRFAHFNTVIENVIANNEIGIFTCGGRGNILEPNIFERNRVSIAQLSGCP